MFEEECSFYYKCRTCSNQAKNLEPLSMLITDAPEQHITYGELLKEVTNINIMTDKSPEMPQYICTGCSRKLKSSHAFIKQAKEVNGKFLSLINKKPGDTSSLQWSEIDVRQCLEIKMENQDVEHPKGTTEPDLEYKIKTEISDDQTSTNFVKDSDKRENLEEEKTTKQTIANDGCLYSNPSKNDMDSSEAESDEEMSIEAISRENTDNSVGKMQKQFTKENNDEDDIAVPCSQCNKIFKNSKDLKRHLTNAHIPEDEKCSCPLCDLKFTRPCNMYKHMRTLHDMEAVKKILPAKEKTHQCHKCPRKYTQKKHLNYHIKEKHSGKEDEETAEEPAANSKNKKSEIRPLCSICGGSYANKADLTVHMRRHTGERPYKCDLCDQAFIRVFQLTCHRRLHTGEKPYKCKICEKAFRVSTKLTAHMRSHTDDRPYKCKQCERSFKYSKDLNIHKRTHTGEMPYSCAVCGNTFAQSHALRAHRLKTGHTDDENGTFLHLLA